MEALTERHGLTCYGTRLGDYRVLLVPDTDAENPRNWDNFGTLWFRPTEYNHNRYQNYGDEGLGDIDSAWLYFTDESPAMQVFGSVRLAHVAFARWLRMVKGATHIKSVSVYEHSGITIRYQKAEFVERPVDWGHGSFDGLIFDTEEGRQDIADPPEAKVREWLTGELETTKAWMEGEVYFVITEIHNETCDDGSDCFDPDCDAWSEVESMGNYYGEKYAEGDAYQQLATLFLTGN